MFGNIVFPCIRFCPQTMISSGNSVVAIVSGLIAEPATASVDLQKWAPTSSFYYGSYTVPFDLAIVFLLGCHIFF